MVAVAVKIVDDHDVSFHRSHDRFGQLCLIERTEDGLAAEYENPIRADDIGCSTTDVE